MTSTSDLVDPDEVPAFTERQLEWLRATFPPPRVEALSQLNDPDIVLKMAWYGGMAELVRVIDIAQTNREAARKRRDVQ